MFTDSCAVMLKILKMNCQAALKYNVDMQILLKSLV